MTGAPAAFSTAATEARLMMETTFLATSEKLWPSPNSTLGGPRNSFGMKRRKNASIASRPSLLRRSPRAAARPSHWIDSVWLASS